MRWLKRDLWKAGIAIAGMLLLLVLIAWLPVSVAGAYERAPGFSRPGTVSVQTTPTVDTTVTALTKEQLTQEVAQQQHTWENWLWSNAATILSSFLSTLVIVLGALFGLWRWRSDRRDAQDKELKDRQNEREKRAEERFQSVVTGLGDEKEGAKIGAAILLRTFLRPGYEQFYIQTFDLVVANLRLPSTSTPLEDPTTSLSPLKQALIVVFKEAFPLARRQFEGSPQSVLGMEERYQYQDTTGIPSLDATGIQLDNAYMREADLKQVWMQEASLRKADLKGATLSEANLFKAKLCEASLTGANLSKATLIKATLIKTWFKQANLSEAKLSEADLTEANLAGADLTKANLEKAQSLKDTDLRGVKGLTKDQLEACKAKGAIIDEDIATGSSQSPASSPPPSQSNEAQAPSAQGSTSTPDTDGSSAASSRPSSQS